MKWRRHVASIVVIVATVLVTLYAWLVDRGKVTDAERARRVSSVFPALRRDDLTRIEMTHGPETLVLERAFDADAPWHMTKPVDATADPAAVEALVSALDYATMLRKIEGDPAAAGAGLDAPRATGTITMGRVTYRFVLGAPAPTPEGAAYLQLEGEGLYVVGRDVANELLLGADAFRERTVVPYLSIALRRLEVQGPRASWAIDRVDDTSFRFDGGGPRVSRDAVDKVWSALAECRAEAYLPDAVADAALKEAPVRVVMTPTAAGAPAGELLVGGACPGHPEDVVLVRRSPSRISACTPKGVLDGLGTTRDDLVDKHLFAARVDEVEELRLEAPGRGAAVDLARKGSGWHERSPSDRDLSKDEIDMANALVLSLVRAEGTPVAPPAGAPAAAPLVRATLTRVESHAQEVVELLPPGNVARRALDGRLLAVSAEIAARLTPRATTVRGREVWPVPLEGRPLASLAVRCAGLDEALVRTDERGPFAFERPKGFPADGAAALDLAEALAGVRADSWVADADDGSYGFDCRVSLGVKIDGGAQTFTLVLGKDAEGGVFAKASDERTAPVFVVSRTVKDQASRPLVDRNSLFVDPGAVTKLVVRRGAATASFTRPEDPPIAALGRLRADEALHFGPARPDEGMGTPSLEVTVDVAGDAGPPRIVRFALGRASLVRDEKMYFARVAGVDATFAVAEERVQPLLDAVPK